MFGQVLNKETIWITKMIRKDIHRLKVKKSATFGNSIPSTLQIISINNDIAPQTNM